MLRDPPSIKSTSSTSGWVLSISCKANVSVHRALYLIGGIALWYAIATMVGMDAKDRKIERLERLVAEQAAMIFDSTSGVKGFDEGADFGGMPHRRDAADRVSRCLAHECSVGFCEQFTYADRVHLTRFAPLTISMTGRPLSRPRKMSDLAI